MNISVLGSTGSIGVQTLDVARMHGIKVCALTANKSAELLERQAREFKPEMVGVLDESTAEKLKISLADTNIKVIGGKEGILAAAQYEKADTVVNAIVGVAGLLPTLSAVRAGKNLALANKETLVAGGSIVIKKVILTASGGSFFGKTRDELKNVTVESALKHPNWSMGKKITIDSATMMNKGLEVIEASWLFGVEDKDIDVLIHRESIIHSMIQLKDNAVIAQLGTADMRIPIQYALTYPERLPSPASELDWSKIAELHFAKPDYETFKCLALCREALRKGGLYPTVANASNEVAVQMFLEEKIKFLDIGDMVEKALADFTDNRQDITLDDILQADRETRIKLGDD